MGNTSTPRKEYFHEASTPIKEPIDCESVFDDFEHLGVNDESTNSNKSTTGFTVITNKKPDDVIKSFFNNPKQFSNNNNCTNSTPNTSGSKKFTKLSQKERKKQLLKPEDTSPPPNGLATSVKNDKPKWTGWGDPIACHSQTNGKVSLASIMKSEESTKESPNSAKPKSAAITVNVNKRVRKPSWKSLSFEESGHQGAHLAQSPPPTNPWKTLPPPEQPAQLQNILQEECVQSQNLTKAQSKPFHITQMEEKAMSDLRAFYNADNVFDEFITVERVDKRVLATPVWKKTKN